MPGFMDEQSSPLVASAVRTYGEFLRPGSVVTRGSKRPIRPKKGPTARRRAFPMLALLALALAGAALFLIKRP
jgi:hypothetical protein